MSKWDEYQNFSTTAAEYGGVHVYLGFLEDNAKKEGKIEGGIVGALVTLGVVGVAHLGHFVYKKSKVYFGNRKQTKQLVSTVRQEFLNNVEQHNAQENIESNKNDIYKG